MPFNLSDNGTVARVGLGSGKLLVRTYDGLTPASPTNDIGFGRGGSLAITRQKAELLLGVPRRLIAQFAIQEDVTLNFGSLEWKADNLTASLSAGVVAGSGADVTIDF